jgi:hypothetical protein
VILVFSGIFSELFLYRKSHELGLWITGPRLALSLGWTRDHGVIAERERERDRERRPSGFLEMTSFEGGAAEMATRRHSIEAIGGASMGRWFQT